MNTILELLVVFPLFVNFIKTPQPPERFDYAALPYNTLWFDGANKIQESNKKLEENQRPKLSENLEDESSESKNQKKTVYTMTESELDALSLSQKAKLLHMNKKTFKTFVKLINREAGSKMQDKIMVAAVIWNRKFCKDYPNTVRKVMYQGGQFTMRGQKKTKIHGDHDDKKAQLAILLAYRMVKTNQIPHNVKNYNAISFRYSDTQRFKKYKHYNNYFVKDTRCKCVWCKQTES